jgi:hypothetical protein
MKFISLRKIVHSYLAHEIIALFHEDFCEGTKNWAENLDRSKLLFFGNTAGVVPFIKRRRKLQTTDTNTLNWNRLRCKRCAHTATKDHNKERKTNNKRKA